MEKILNDVLKKIKPDRNERNRLSDTSEKLMEKAKKAGENLSIDIEPKLVGSTARGTWISEERDIDLFLLFSKDTPRNELEEKGLEIGHKISGGEGKEQYAEHPYIKTTLNGFDVDIVPCYDIDDPTNIRSAVDRSPHHQKYVEEHLNPERRKEVLLLKKFLMGIGAYGSELKVHGFSGYLCELLVIHFDSFEKLIKSAKDWGDGKIIDPDHNRDPEDLRTLFPDDPLIFIDPVDPGRNVAAAVSKRNYATFVRASQDFTEDPGKTFFFPNPPIRSEKKLSENIKRRETKLFMISIDIPFDLVPDIIYPQLRKTKKKLVERVEREDFQVLRSAVWSDNETAVILIELKFRSLPKAKKHLGPPLGIDSKPFVQKHLDSRDKLAGPFIDEDGRLVFELERTHTDAREVISNSLQSTEGLGKHIGKSIKKEGYKIAEDYDVVELAENLEASEFLGEYLTRCLPWYR